MDVWMHRLMYKGTKGHWGNENVFLKTVKDKNVFVVCSCFKKKQKIQDKKGNAKNKLLQINLGVVKKLDVFKKNIYGMNF